MLHSWRRLASETLHLPCFRRPIYFRRLTTAVKPNHPPSQAPIAYEASKAIKVAVSEGSLADAFLLLNSIHIANTKSPSLLMDRLSGMMAPFQVEPIPFRKGTPIRLAAHSLLHSLMREGYLEEACKLSEQLMKQNIRIHYKSLDVLFGVLTEHPPTTPRVPVQAHQEVWTANILKSESLEQRHIQHFGGSYALRLLHVARQSRQKRSRNMFKTLITLCIINGEIIAASLLFGILVKDWNARAVEELETQKKEKTKKKKEPPQKGSAIRKVQQRQTAWPSENRLVDILTSIERHLKVRDYAIEGEHEAALQALANLAVLLDQRLIPFQAVAPLLRLLRHAAQLDGTVNVPNADTQEMHTVQAPVFFASVLDNLSTRLPKHHAPNKTAHTLRVLNKGFLPALDRHSYNQLVIWALHHKRDTEHAKNIVYHLTCIRRPTIQPDAMMADSYHCAAISTLR